MMLSLSTIHLLLMQHKNFTWSQRSREFEEIHQMWGIWLELRFLIGGRTSPEGWPDKSGNPYWNPVRKAGYVRCQKPDSPVCQTGYSGFGWTDHWSGNQILESFLLKANTIFFTGDKSFQFMHLWTRFDDLTWDKDIQGVWFKRKEIYGLERHLFTNG